MKAKLTFLSLLSALVLLAHCHTPNTLPNSSDPLAAARTEHLKRLAITIAGREKTTVDSVFQNLKVLGGFPAENLLVAMKAWSEALGVGCDHCHVPNEWASDSKPAKEIARQMVALGERINADLRKIQGLKSERPGVNCYTCHRGALKPARRAK